MVKDGIMTKSYLLTALLSYLQSRDATVSKQYLKSTWCDIKSALQCSLRVQCVLCVQSVQIVHSVQCVQFVQFFQSVSSISSVLCVKCVQSVQSVQSVQCV